MKNLKSPLLLFMLCALLTIQFNFAQDDKRTAQDQAKIKAQMTRDSGENQMLMLEDLKTLQEQYDSASENERPALKEEIRKLKASYSKELKGIDEDVDNGSRSVKVLGQEYNAEDNAKKVQNSEEILMVGTLESLATNMSEKEAFIQNAKMRLEIAKIKLASDIEDGSISEMNIKLKKKKIAQVEEKLINHQASIYEAKKRNKQLSEIVKE